MYNILTLNKISKKGLSLFNSNYSCSNTIENPDAILVRSASLLNLNFNNELLAISRAGAGVNNIPIDKCSENGIIVFNTPGANANAVKELVIAALFISSRKIIEAIEFCKTLKTCDKNISKIIEKEKSKFAGPEIKNKKLGVIGLGAIGKLVANAACDLSMDVYGYDPYISIDSAWGLSDNVKLITSIDKLFSICDYISLHIPLNPDTENFINKDNIIKMKNNVRILNFSRGDLVNSEDIIQAVNSKKVSCYITDFPTNNMLSINGIIPIPHLGASTPESENNCAIMAVNQLIDYLENGNITNSVNMPNIKMEKEHGILRICIIHKNIKNMISSISAQLADKGINIENMQSKSKENYAYSIFDIDNKSNINDLLTIKNINGVKKIRVITPN